MVLLCLSAHAWFRWAEVRIGFNLCNVEQAASPPNDGSIPVGGREKGSHDCSRESEGVKSLEQE